MTEDESRKDEARKLVAEVLGAEFNRDAFARLLAEMLGGFNPGKAGTFNGRYRPEAYRHFVSRYERIGQYVGPDESVTDLLVVELEHGGSAFRARAAQRAFVANYLKRRGEKNAALVAFHFPGETAWRFSLVRMEYRIRKTKTGKLAAKPKFSAVRRLSFLVGGKNTHTAQNQLAELIARKNPPNLDDLEGAFSVMPVTLEFFRAYRKLYERALSEVKKARDRSPAARADFKEKGIKPADFAKKLLGQIVFLHFLQRKGWLGVKPDGKWGDGSRDFLREQFQAARQGKTPFYEKILQPLFYEALRADRDDGFYAALQCRIPFLNGGLFEPLNGHNWGKAGLQLPDRLFSNGKQTPDGDDGDGILDVFARYNFTVAEDEPAEREVAVDPEMLGKVFENLIEEEARQAQGAYYTPREIVHFMCRESLRKHLAAETARRKIPAGESELNAFIEIADFVRETEELLAGKTRTGDMTNKIPLPAGIRRHAAKLDEILRQIRVCDPAVGSGAFVVGMMHEIIRLRAALAPALGIREADAYRMKRDAIRDSLYGVDKDGGAVDIAQLRLWLSMVVDEENPEKIQPLPNLDYKIVSGDTLTHIRNVFNNEKFWELEEKQDAFFNETRRTEKRQLRGDIERIVNELTGQHPELDPMVHFSRANREHGGFDIVIGNPPYDVLNEQRANPAQKKYAEEMRKLYKYSVSGGKINLYRLFIERGFQLACKGGVLSLIVPNTLLADLAAAGVRQMMAKDCALRFLIEFPERARVFESASQAVAIFLLEKGRKPSGFGLSIDTQTPDLPPASVVRAEWSKIREICGNELAIPLVRIQAEYALMEKIHKGATSLGALARIGLGDVNLTTNREFISNDKRPHLLVRGENISRYAVDLSDQNTDRRWIDFEMMRRKMSSRKFETIRFASGQERIACQNIANMGMPRRIIAGLIGKRVFVGHSANYIHPQIGVKWDVRALLAVLSSRLLNWRFKKTSSNNHVNVYELARLPFPCEVPSRTLSRLSALAAGILSAKRSDSRADTLGMEAEIDRMVYGLYGLTDREIALVEED